MKETHYKLKHRVTALFAAAVMLCSMLPGAAFAEEPTPQPTEETVQMEQQTEPSETDNGQTDESSPDPGEDADKATSETAEEQLSEEEISAAVVGSELYTDLPDAPIGSYIGNEGLPVATGKTKIGISEWPESQLEETSGSYLTAAALDNDGLTMAAPLLDGADYAIVPILAQVEYPADGSSLDLILPDSVTLLDYYGAPAEDAESLLHNEYSETSAAVLGVYVQADANFTAQLVYTAPDGSTLTKTLQVAIDRNATAEYPFPDSEIAAFAERPTPAVTSGKITKVAKVNGTWLIWFNGEPAYCCTPGADGQPKNCPTYTYVNTSMVGADQYVPGDHYGNQYRIWGGLTQLSLGMQELPPVALSAEAPSLLDSCRTIYTDAQMQIIENYPDSTAAKILIGSAQTLLEGTDAYASARGYYTYIYQPGRAGWQTVAVIGPEISDDEPNPKPIVQEIYANWEAPAQTASGSFDFDYGIITNKVQLKTTEKVDGATIEIEPITKSGTIAAADSFDGFITELQNMGYTVKYGPRVEHMAVRHKDAQRNIRIDRLDPRFSETALREYYHKLHRMPTEMQQEYRQENAPAKPKWQPTELQPTVRRARYLGKLPRRYPKVSGFMACYYHYCALLRKAYHGKSTKRCYFLLREDFLLFSRYQQQTKFLWENHIETMDELLAYKESAEVQIQQLARQRKVLYRQKREPERAAREEKIKSLTQQMKALRHKVYICSDIETDAAEVQEKLRQAELAAQEERNEVKQDEQRRRSSRSDGAGSLTGYRSSH